MNHNELNVDHTHFGGLCPRGFWHTGFLAYRVFVQEFMWWVFLSREFCPNGAIFILCSKFLIVAVPRRCFTFLSFKYHFKALNEWSLILVFVGWKSVSIWILGGILKIQFFSQETYNFPILRNEALVIADYEDIKISIFASSLQVMPKGRFELHTNNPWYSYKNRSFKRANVPQNSAFFRPYFATNETRISLHFRN